MDEWVRGWTVGWVEGWKDRRTHEYQRGIIGWTDGRRAEGIEMGKMRSRFDRWDGHRDEEGRGKEGMGHYKRRKI